MAEIVIKIEGIKAVSTLLTLNKVELMLKEEIIAKQAKKIEQYERDSRGNNS